MKFKKQKELIENLISSKDAFAICNSILDYEYFDIELREAVNFILKYFDKYSSIPTPKQIEAETDVELELKPVTEDLFDYTVDEVEAFCQTMAVQDAVMKSAQIISSGEDTQKIQEVIKEALEVSVKKDLGLDYFETVEERLDRMQDDAALISTPWPMFNKLTFGGLARKEMILFAANSGGGKSVVLSNLALHFTDLGLNALYLSFELSQDIVSQRFDTNITRVSRKNWRDHKRTIVAGVTEYNKEHRGKLQIKYMPTETKAVHIRTYLEQYKLHFGFYPDILCVDYLDKMIPNARVDGNAFDVDKKIAEQLRQIGVDYNLVLATASQLNRSAINEPDQHHGHIAGGISKINESDTVVSIYKPLLEGDGKTQTLESATFKFLKTRNSDGVDQSIEMDFNKDYIRFEEKSGASHDQALKQGMDNIDKGRKDRIKNETKQGKHQKDNSKAAIDTVSELVEGQQRAAKHTTATDVYADYDDDDDTDVGDLFETYDSC